MSKVVEGQPTRYFCHLSVNLQFGDTLRIRVGKSLSKQIDILLRFLDIVIFVLQLFYILGEPYLHVIRIQIGDLC